MSGLNDKVILLTGAGGGIGQASAVVFAKAGARLALTDINVEHGHATLAMLKEIGAGAVFIKADLSQESEVAALVGQTIKQFGRLDGAFNNAGVAQHGVALHELTSAQWLQTIQIDLTATFLCLKYEIKVMLECGHGAIVNAASGLGARAIQNAADYIAAKHGVIGLTRAAAVEYASRGIRINAVMPGVIETPMVKQLAENSSFEKFMGALKARHPIGRFGHAHEVSEAVKWLLSNESSFVNGEALAVDGGYLAN